MAAGMGLSKAPDTKFLILAYQHFFYISTRVDDLGAWQYAVLYAGVDNEKAADYDHESCLPRGLKRKAEKS
jgi:hypothetical protein